MILNAYLKKNRLPIFTMHFDFPTVGFCHRLGNRKPDSSASRLFGAGIIRAVEAVEQPGKVSGILKMQVLKTSIFCFHEPCIHPGGCFHVHPNISVHCQEEWISSDGWNPDCRIRSGFLRSAGYRLYLVLSQEKQKVLLPPRPHRLRKIQSFQGKDFPHQDGTT